MLHRIRKMVRNKGPLIRKAEGLENVAWFFHISSRSSLLWSSSGFSTANHKPTLVRPTDVQPVLSKSL
jgi:hypothetical protein